MANIVKKSEELEEKLKKAKKSRASSYAKLLAIFIVAAALLIAGLVKFDSFIVLAGTGIFFVGAVYLVIVLKGRDKAAIIEAGLEGENMTERLLERLPDSYTVFKNAHITYDGKMSEVDNIVVGKGGVFIIESKNHRGRIVGNMTDTNWEQTKIGRGGTPYTKTFYSPVRQISTHIYRLAHYLRENGADVYVNGIVYFSNPEAEVVKYGYLDDIAVYSFYEQRDMLSFITKNFNDISDKDVKKVIELLK